VSEKLALAKMNKMLAVEVRGFREGCEREIA
jgi:hypothetical protein